MILQVTSAQVKNDKLILQLYQHLKRALFQTLINWIPSQNEIEARKLGKKGDRKGKARISLINLP